MIYKLLGTLILWFGWYGFNPASAFLLGKIEYGDILAVVAATNSTLAAAGGGLSTLFLNYYVTSRYSGRGKYSLVHCMNGTLSGLVAITAGCGVVEPYGAVIIGFISGVLYLLGSWGLIKLRLDDAVDAIPVHLINGIWGLLAVGLFASPRYLQMAYNNTRYPGLFYAGQDGRVHGNLLAAQICDSLFIMAWTSFIMFPFFTSLEYFGSFRVDAREEVAGLDKVYFGELAATEEVTPEHLKRLTQEVEEHLRMRRRMSSSGRSSSSQGMQRQPPSVQGEEPPV